MVLTMLAGGISVYFLYVAPRRKKESGFEFVYVEEDGKVRECTFEEIEWLNRNFSRDDVQMPPLKRTYEERKDGRISGFILRRKVPPDIQIGKAAKGPQSLN
jgi:hypothetical protein